MNRAIGLDLDELHTADELITLEATLREVDADVSGQEVWAELRPHGDPAGVPVEARLEWDGERGYFRGRLPGRPRASTTWRCSFSRCLVPVI